MANLNEKLAAGDLPFNETEKNAAAFKGLYQILNSSAFKENFFNEQFAKSYLVFPDDIISEAKTILQAPTSPDILFVKPALTKTWPIAFLSFFSVGKSFNNFRVFL